MEIPGYKIDNPGPSWYQLGGSKRNPFHLYFSQEEAQELQDIVMELKQTQDVIEKFGLEMDEDEINLLLDVLTPKLEKRKNPERATFVTLTYFRRLSEYTEKYGILDITGDNTDDYGSPGPEDTRTLQNCMANAQDVAGIWEGIRLPRKHAEKPKILDTSQYFDAQGDEAPQNLA